LFFFSSRRRHTRSKRDWSSDVCSSDLVVLSNILNVTVERINPTQAIIENKTSSNHMFFLLRFVWSICLIRYISPATKLTPRIPCESETVVTWIYNHGVCNEGTNGDSSVGNMLAYAIIINAIGNANKPRIFNL